MFNRSAVNVSAISRILIVVVLVVIIIAAGAGTYFLAFRSTSGTTTTTTTTTLTPTTSTTTTTSVQPSSTTTTPTTISSSSTNTSSNCTSKTPVSFSTDFSVTGQHAPYFAGIDQGFYAQNCLSVTVDAGHGTASTIDEVATGTVTFGLAETPILALDEAQGTIKNVSVIAQIFEVPDLTVFYISNGPFNIASPKDFSGQTVTGGSGGFYTQILPTTLSAMGATNVNYVLTPDDSGSLELGKGQVAGYAAALYNFASIQSDVSSVNPSYKLAYFQPSNYGIYYLSYGLIASDNTINSNPTMVKEFVKAVLESWAWSYSNPSTAVGILLKYHPELQYNDSISRLTAAFPLVFTPPTYTQGLGYLNETSFAATINAIQKSFNLM